MMVWWTPCRGVCMTHPDTLWENKLAIGWSRSPRESAGVSKCAGEGEVGVEKNQGKGIFHQFFRVADVASWACGTFSARRGTNLLI